MVLEGIDLPAARADLVAYAAREDAGAAAELSQIPDREYASIDEVGEELVRVQPRPPAEAPPPRPESGAPPGGEEYVNPAPESGAVRPNAPPGRPASEQIDAASATVKRQAKVQES